MMRIGGGAATGALAALSLLAAAGAARADVCLAPERLDAFLAQETAYDIEAFLSGTAADAAPGEPICRREQGWICPLRPGIYGVWSNNAAAYWVGPIISDAQEADSVAIRLTALSERAAMLTAEGDYGGATHGRVVVRAGECFAEGGEPGRPDPELLYAVGREAVALREQRAKLAELAAGAAERAAGATDALLAEIGRLEERLRAAAFGAEPGQPVSRATPLGRLGDGLTHLAAEPADEALRRAGAGSGGAGRLTPAFAGWLAEASAIALASTGIPPAQRSAIERLALILYLRAPEPFEALAAHLAPGRPEGQVTDPALFFDAIAARYRELDALAGFAEAWAEAGPLREAAQALAAFAGRLPDPAKRRILGAHTGSLFAVGEAESGTEPAMPSLDALRRLALAGMRMPVMAERTQAAAAELAESGLATAVGQFARDAGISLDAEALARSLLAAAHTETAASLLRAALGQAFADDPATAEHIESLAAGRFDRFADALLANLLAPRLAAAGFEARELLAAELAESLGEGEPERAHRLLARAAAEQWPPAWQRGLAALLDGRAGDAATRLLGAELAAAGLSEPAVEAVLEGAAGNVAEQRLADRLGLPPAQLAALEAGRAPDYVRNRAAAALAADEGERAAFAERLAEDPETVLASARRAVEAELLARLSPAAAETSLADLADSDGRRQMATALMTERVESDSALAAALPAEAVEALFADDRAAAAVAALSPLLGGVPGAEALLAGRPDPYRDGVAGGLRTALGDALGAEATRLLAPEALAALRQGDMESLGQRYARRIFARAELHPQTIARLLAGDRAAALEHEGRLRSGRRFARLDPEARIARALWRAEALIDLRREALARRRLIHGIAAAAAAGGRAEAR